MPTFTLGDFTDNDEQALYEFAKIALPKWLTNGLKTVSEWLNAFAAMFDQVRIAGQAWLDITYILQSFGPNLDQHAKDRGTQRRAGESDLALQQRLINITDAVTQPAVEANINTLLAQNGLTSCAIVNLRLNRGHFHATGFSNTFFSRGYRMASNGFPSGYVVILPFGTTQTIQDSVNEYLRQYGPAGYFVIVEVNQTPP